MDKDKSITISNHLRFSSQVLRFIISGIISSTVDIVLLYFFVEYVHLTVFLSTILSILAATSTSYLLSIKYVFRQGKMKPKDEIISFYALAGFGFVFNLFLMWLFYEVFGIYYIASRLISISINVIINYIVKKKIIFLN